MSEDDFAEIIANIDALRHAIEQPHVPWMSLPEPWASFDWMLVTMRDRVQELRKQRFG